jgi:GR25 family glycosyltransferase involved in LPS biosynthesis
MLEKTKEAGQLTQSTALARALTKQGLFEEADDELSRAVNKKHVALMDLVEWIKLPSIQAEYAKALERIEEAKTKINNEVLLRLEVQTLLFAKSFVKLTALLESILLDGENIEWAKKILNYVRCLNAIEVDISSKPVLNKDYVGYCVNLDEQEQKWKRCQLEASITNLGLHRLPGVKGSYLPNSVLKRLGNSMNENFMGTLGCFLSHLNAWEKFLATDKRYALIVEDDFRPLVKFPSAIAGFSLPLSFDICWVTQRMDMSTIVPFAFKEVSEVVNRRASPAWLACGTEGYILSRNGAQELINYVSEDGLFGDVDWRMMTYSLSAKQIERLDKNTFASQAMQAHLKTVKSRPPLLSISSSVGLIGLVSSGSIRRIQNSGRHAHEHV